MISIFFSYYFPVAKPLEKFILKSKQILLPIKLLTIALDQLSQMNDAVGGKLLQNIWHRCTVHTFSPCES